MPAEDACAASNLRKETIYFLSLVSFITKEASLENVKKQYFFLSYCSAVTKLVWNNSFFLSNDSKIASL